MNERMTDERAQEVDEGVTAAGWKAARGLAAEIRVDWMRARASEVAKDATIEALADALEPMGGYSLGRWHTGDCLERWEKWRVLGCTPKCTAATDALRLAGRLPSPE